MPIKVYVCLLEREVLCTFLLVLNISLINRALEISWWADILTVKS